MIVRSSTERKGQCFGFGDNSMTGTICIPKESLEKENVDCPTFVSTHLIISNQKTNMFPETIIESSSNISKPTLGPNLLGLSVNNRTSNFSLERERIKLTFDLKKQDGECLADNPKSRTCVWWDEASISWSGSGCSLSLEETNDTVTVCYCDHLTNFGIMFDYTGEAEPGDPILSILSWVLLTISSIAILITQFLIFCDKVKIRSLRKSHALYGLVCIRVENPDPRPTY